MSAANAGLLWETLEADSRSRSCDAALRESIGSALEQVSKVSEDSLFMVECRNASGHWDDAGWTISEGDGDKPWYFKSQGEARTAIKEFIRDTKAEGMDGYAASDYRVVPVPVVWIMPASAACVLRETLDVDAQSSAFDSDLRLRIFCALQEMVVVSDSSESANESPLPLESASPKSKSLQKIG